MPEDGVLFPIRLDPSGIATGAASALGALRGFAMKGAAILGVGFGMRAIFSGVKDMIGEASEAQTAQTALAAVVRNVGKDIGVTMDQMRAYATAIQNVTIFSDEEAMAAERSLAAMRLRGDVLKEALTLSADMASAGAQEGATLSGTAKMVGRALADPQRGLMLLTRQGVVFTEQQREQIKAMTETGDLAGAQQIVLDRLKASYGGVAAIMGKTYVGQVKILANAWSEVKEAIGTAFLPVALQALELVRQAVAAVPWGSIADGVSLGIVALTHFGNIASIVFNKIGLKISETGELINQAFESPSDIQKTMTSPASAAAVARAYANEMADALEMGITENVGRLLWKIKAALGVNATVGALSQTEAENVFIGSRAGWEESGAEERRRDSLRAAIAKDEDVLGKAIAAYTASREAIATVQPLPGLGPGMGLPGADAGVGGKFTSALEAPLEMWRRIQIAAVGGKEDKAGRQRDRQIELLGDINEALVRAGGAGPVLG